MAIRETLGWAQAEPGGPLAERTIALDPRPGDVIVGVAGCGVCHTDLGFLDGTVAPRGGRPLVPGHEIAGVVVEAPAEYAALVGRQVIVPAVWPCGSCDLCDRGRSNACQAQRMPGNDVPGGFARHVAAPARWLAQLPQEVRRGRLIEMAVIADAVATPYAAVRRANLSPGELAIVVGAGGLGGFLVQIAAARGALVVALDVDDARLGLAREHGARGAIDVRGLSERDARDRVVALAKEIGAPRWHWKIFETSGTAAGQKTAYGLLGPAATLMVVGYTRDRVELRLSNVMAFDATVAGVWGCRPSLYGEAIDLVLSDRVKLAPFVETRPMAEINDVVADAHAGKLRRRVVLLPDGGGEGGNA